MDTISDSQRGRSGHRARQLLRDAIIDGRLRPGERLVEQRLADEFGLSRTPVRQALVMLQADGLVVNVPNRGAVVRPLSIDYVTDLYGLRCRLEGYAAFRAAERITEDQLEDLRRTHRRFELTLEQRSEDGDQWLVDIKTRNNEFHEQVIAASGDPRLVEVVRGVVDVPLVFRAFQYYTEEELARSRTFHALIIGTLERHEGARAEALMREHVLQGRDVLLEHAAIALGPPSEDYEAEEGA